MTDERVNKFAQILVDHSTRIQPGDRVLLEGTTAALPLIEVLYELILQRGGHPYPNIELPDAQKLFYKYASQAQLEHVPAFKRLAYEQFESRMRILSVTDPRALNDVDPAKQAIFSKTSEPIHTAQMRRGATGEFKWVTTLFPTQGYADEAGMTLATYEDFVYSAVHADKEDPIAIWRMVEKEQQHIVDVFNQGDKVELRGPNVDLSLSVKGRTFLNAAGEHNMPDGELFTGPVEDSANGWVRFTYPAIYQGRSVEDAELKFEDGYITQATARTNQDFMLKMLDSDKGARYLGEFAIGTNFGISRFTGEILFDEKIGGSFHIAMGAGYPETGSVNESMIHWDMICDMRKDAEIVLDGEVVYKNGEFQI
jgi:aminopeptidase